MIDTPTTTVTILGGVTTRDTYGDDQDGAVPIRSGVPAAIHQINKLVTTESETEPRAVRFFVGRLPNWTKGMITGANRIQDDRTGEIYLIDAVDVPASAVIEQDVRLDLRRVTS